MKKIISIIFLTTLIFLAIPTTNAKLIIINTNKYEPAQETQIQKNINRTIIITKPKRISNLALDQNWYNFKRNQIFNQRINDIINKELNYQDKTATKERLIPIPKSQYSKYYECYDEQFDRYYKDYNYNHPCLN